MKRHPIAITVIAAAVALLVAIIAPSSSASGGPASVPAWQGPLDAPPTAATNPLAITDCTSNHLCLWVDGSYSGSLWVYGSQTKDAWHDVEPGNDDNTSSFYNNRSVYVSYLDKDYPPSGNGYCYKGQAAIQHLSLYYWPDGSNMNDSISSYNLLTISTCS